MALYEVPTLRQYGMALIVAIHGIGQQFKGDAIIHREWWPALLSRLHLAGSDLKDSESLPSPDCVMIRRSIELVILQKVSAQ